MSDETMGDAAPSVNLFNEIDGLCRDFRRRWKHGPRPRIEDELDRVNGKARPMLLRNLLHVELEYRRRGGETPEATEYLRRFPDHASVIRQAFFLSTMQSADGTAGWDQPTTDRDRAPAASRLGDYQLVGELGRGGMGVVYEAVHVGRGHRVALKTLPGAAHGQTDAERLSRFRREFRSLADVSHPNLVGMQSLEVDGDQWFLTMDLVDGVDFLSHVRPRDALDEGRLRSALPQLVSAVMALHGRHIVHRDLKPSNVLVTASGHVLVLDFGLAAEAGPLGEETASIASHSRHFAGTAAYAAPEQATGERTAASDWYALGVMLFQALTGALPFRGTVFEVLARKQNEDAPPLSGRSGVPADLAELVDRLLARNPEDRPDALAIATAISARVPVDPPSASGGRIIVGRAGQLAALDEALRQVRQTGEPRAVFIAGRSGEGKTTLVEHFLSRPGRRVEAVVLAGRCYDREAVPLKALDALVDPLSHWLRKRRDDVSADLPEDTHMLARLFPELRRVPAVDDLAAGQAVRIDMKQVRRRAFVALRELLRRVGLRAPVVLFIDDLQWGDADSAEALADLLKPPAAPAVLLLGTYRSDEAEHAPFLRAWRQRQAPERTVSVGPLSLDECVELVVARLGEDTPRVRRQAAAIFEATGGNPYFLDQLIDCTDLEAEAMHAVPLHEVIARKLGRLPLEAEALLRIVAVAGHSIDVAEAAEAAGVGAEAVATLTHMRTERLVRLLGEGQEQVETYHDKIREEVEDRLPPADRRELHRRLGETIERREGVTVASTLENPSAAARVYDLATHFDSAGEAGKAFGYALAAAERAREGFALELALEYYGTAERHAKGEPGELRYRIAAGRGEALLLTGRYTEAEAAIREALDLTVDTLELARLELALGEIAYRSKSLRESIDTYQAAMGRLGIRVPTTVVGLVASSVVRAALRRFEPAARPGPMTKAEFLAARLYDRIMFSYYFNSMYHMAWAIVRGWAAGTRHPEDPTYPIHLKHLVGSSVIFGILAYRPFRHLLDASLMEARRRDDLHVFAEVLRLLGLPQLAAGRLREGLATLTEAAELLRTRVADAGMEATSGVFITNALCRLGDLDAAARRARASFEQATRRSQHRHALMTLAPWVRATDGDLPFDELRACAEQDPDDHLIGVQMHYSEALWHLARGRTAEAVAAAERAVERYERQWIMNMETVGCFPILARALRAHADAVAAEHPRLARRLRRRGLHYARKGARRAWMLRLEYPFALRELGLALAALGRNRGAWRKLRKSVRVAEEQGARHEHALSLSACATLARRLHRPDADDWVSAAEAACAANVKTTPEAQSGDGRPQ